MYRQVTQLFDFLVSCYTLNRQHFVYKHINDKLYSKKREIEKLL
jgi:hypothetical protein